MKAAVGQMSIFDVVEKTKPCQYSFTRYIGMCVILPHAYNVKNKSRGIRGRITKIEKYYTIVKGDDGSEYCGTPYDMQPEE